MKDAMITVLEHPWTPICLGLILSFWTLALDTWTGGFGLVLFAGLAMWKGFMKQR